MLLTIDVGNSEADVGAWEGDQLIRRWRLSTRQARTPDEWRLILQNLLQGMEMESTVLASVVPPLTKAFQEVCEELLGRSPLILTHKLELGIRLEVDKPHQVGADRIANTLAVQRSYGRDAIVVDLGTATTVDVITADGAFLGGVIAPGFEASTRVLFESTAVLPLVAPHPPPSVIGRDTEECIQSGIYHGQAAMIDGLVDRIQAEWGVDPLVLATGGRASELQPLSGRIQQVDTDLTLRGLWWVQQMVGRSTE